MRGLLIAVLLVAAAGCGKPGREGHPVSGDVKLDGAPVERGMIRLAPTGRAAPVGAEIKAGRYALVAPAGEFRVEISAPRVVGRRKAYDTPDSPLVDVTEEAVPERYNAQSELRLEVKPGANEKSFELSTK